MMEPEKQSAEIISLIQQIRNEVVSRGKYFELGDEPGPLDSIEGAFNKIQGILESLNNYYLSKPLRESNPFLSAIRVVHRVQDFLKEVRLKGGGSTGNTSRILALLDELDSLIAQLNGKNIFDAPAEHNLGNKSSQTSSSAPSDHQIIKPVQLVSEPSLFPQSSSRRLSTSITSIESQIKKNSRLGKVFLTIFVSFPRIVGRTILDIFGRDKAMDSSAILLGYILILLVLLVFFGIVGVDTLHNLFINWWRFFFPVK